MNESNELNESAAEWIDIGELVPWEENPRINDQAIEKVMVSIQRFGFASPIIARKADKMIIAGHTRYSAALKIGLSKVPVRLMNLDPADAKMLALADNKLGEIASWDSTSLAQILTDLKSENKDLSGLGWDNSQLDDIMDLMSDYHGTDAEWQTFDESIGETAAEPKKISCPHCNKSFLV